MKCEEGNKLDLKNAANNFPFQQQNNYHSNDIIIPGSVKNESDGSIKN